LVLGSFAENDKVPREHSLEGIIIKDLIPQ
jgi:hypothetical protein